MAINNLDYKLQPELENVVADIISRPNAIAKRYTKADFRLDFWAQDYEIENYRWILERARIADEKISEAQSKGFDTDDTKVLEDIANEVNDIIKDGKKKGSWANYFIYLIIPGLIVALLFILI